MSKLLEPTKFSLLLFQNDVDVVVKADKARDILGCMIKLPWDVNRNLSSHIAAHLPLMQLPKNSLPVRSSGAFLKGIWS